MGADLGEDQISGLIDIAGYEVGGRLLYASTGVWLLVESRIREHNLTDR